MDTWDAVVDVSNVCWSPFLPPEGRSGAFLSRLELVMAAWRDLHGEGAALRLVADDSLWRALSGEQKSGFRRYIDEAGLVTRPVADELILQLARDEGLQVITRDHYVDHRAAHPWIERFPERFHCWTVTDGRVRFEQLDIVPRSAQSVSGAIELKDLRWSVRLDSRNPGHRKILRTRWKCPNAQCPEARQWQEQVLVWPVIGAGDTALCPACGDSLAGLGPRDQLYEMVASDLESGEEITRFPLETGFPLIVGRAAGLKGIDLSAGEAPSRDAIMQVSREHLLLRLEHVHTSWRIVAVDAGSSNGTTVQRWEGTAFQPPRPAAAGEDVYLGVRDRLVLGAAVTLRVSGKHYLLPDAGDGRDGADAGDGADGDQEQPGADSDVTVVTDARPLPG